MRKPHQKTASLLHWCKLIPLYLLILFSCTPLKTTRQKKVAEAKQEPLAFDRSKFGTSPLLFWYHLTDFEITTLQNAEKAKQGDPDALLALAVFASGNVRDSETYMRYHKRVSAFVDLIRPAIAETDSVYKKGHILYTAMCKEFFKRRMTDDALKGYHFGQSQITELFRTAKFNCISSSLLYIILARYFGLTVKGVNLPSHIFVHLAIPDGKIIEIETTIKNGYGIVHDREFYKKQGKAWFTQRGLPRSTYEDYLKRQIMEPYEVACFNMNNQHTSPDRMAAFDRNRLLEAMGFVNTKDSYSQNNRLIVYNNEFNYLKKNEDFSTLGRMFEKINSLIPELREQWSAHPEMIKNLLLIEYAYAYTLSRTGKISSAMDTLKHLLARLGESMPLYSVLIHNSHAIIGNYCTQLIKEKKYTEGIMLLDSFTGPPHLTAKLLVSYTFLYETWARDLWDKKEWPQTIARNEQALSYARTSEDSSRIVENIEGAYANWAIGHFRAKDKKQARAVLEKCLQSYPDSKTCRKNLKIMSR